MIMRHGASGAIAPQRLNCLVVAERQTWLRVDVLGGYMDGLTSACSFLPAGSACSFLSENRCTATAFHALGLMPFSHFYHTLASAYVPASQ